MPDEERIGQIKAREKPKRANPFNADSDKARQMREKAKKKDLEQPVWRPSIERVDADVQDSVAGMVAKMTQRKSHVSQPRFVSVSTPAK